MIWSLLTRNELIQLLWDVTYSWRISNAMGKSRIVHVQRTTLAVIDIDYTMLLFHVRSLNPFVLVQIFCHRLSVDQLWYSYRSHTLFYLIPTQFQSTKSSSFSDGCTHIKSWVWIWPCDVKIVRFCRISLYSIQHPRDHHNPFWPCFARILHQRSDSLHRTPWNSWP